MVLILSLQDMQWETMVRTQLLPWQTQKRFDTAILGISHIDVARDEEIPHESQNQPPDIPYTEKVGSSIESITQAATRLSGEQAIPYLWRRI